MERRRCGALYQELCNRYAALGRCIRLLLVAKAAVQLPPFRLPLGYHRGDAGDYHRGDAGVKKIIVRATPRVTQRGSGITPMVNYSMSRRRRRLLRRARKISLSRADCEKTRIASRVQRAGAAGLREHPETPPTLAGVGLPRREHVVGEVRGRVGFCFCFFSLRI